MSILSSANVTDVNLVLKEHTHMPLCLNMLIFTHNLGNWLIALLLPNLPHFTGFFCNFNQITITQAGLSDVNQMFATRCEQVFDKYSQTNFRSSVFMMSILGSNKLQYCSAQSLLQAVASLEGAGGGPPRVTPSRG